MGAIKGLMKDTAIYGLSSIVGRFLNWCLVPLYTIMFAVAEYGVVTYVYSVVALVLIILTYGLETGFFRFANHDRWRDPMEVYSTGLISLGMTSVAFITAVMLFLEPVTDWMECRGHESYVVMMTVCVAIDAFCCLPFAYLRFRKRPLRFASLKLINIGLNIALNLFFILGCPWLMKVAPGTVNWFYDADFGIGYIFLANLIASCVTLLMLTPHLCGFRWRFTGRLWKEMMVYCLPLLVLGIAGIMNQTIDKILYPSLVSDPAEAMDGLGIYGANYKIAIVMVMFTQAFRFAYEPFIFAQSRQKAENGHRAYADAMKYFIIFALIIFMGVMFYLDILKYFISPKYFSGLKVVPIVMLAEVFYGVFFNLSLWYKLTDRTVWGMYFSLAGLAVTLILNALLVPIWGYMGCAWAAFFCYLAMMMLSYFTGRVKYPIDYPVKSIAMYVLVAAACYALGMYAVRTPWLALDFVVRGLILAAFATVVIKRERISFPNPVKILLHR
ncbi:MAG: polysaccharide biosynthesis C-terminal domain-containing protein [Bacteroidales bacterium]|nr:polysaccharide biosynthesis C-terminal domain-containing protein [Bacteroidales bacterium]